MKILIAAIPQNAVNYEKALTLCRIPFDTSLHPEELSSYDKLLLPGGGDIEPSRFGQENHGSKQIDPRLDAAQFALLDAFVQAGKPVLGICRGLQVINVYFGGDIIQNLPTADAHRQDTNGHDQIHTVCSTPGSLLCELCRSTCLVNSAHHQGCRNIGTSLKVTQRASDHTVEALEHSTRPILGVQWHPERTGLISGQPDLVDGMKIIRYFAEQL